MHNLLRPFHKNTIRFRLSISFIGLAVGPLLLIGISLAWQSFQHQRHQALDIQREVAQRISSEVSAFFRSIEGELNYAVKIRALQTLDDDQLDAVFSLLPAVDKAIESIAIVDKNGFDEFSLSRIGIRSPESGAIEWSRLPEFTIPLQTEKVYYSHVRFAEGSSEPLLTMGVPIENLQSGESEGVLIADVRIKAVWNLIADSLFSPDESVYIVDARNRVIAHKNPSVVLRGTDFEIPATEGIEIGLDGHRVVLASHELVLGQQSLTVVTEKSVTQSLALAYNTMWITSAAILGMLVVSSLLSVLSLRQILRPINSLQATARNIVDGDLEQVAEIQGPEEIGELAQTFNRLTRWLRATLDGLNRNLAELQVAKDEAEAANIAKSEFLANMSHEIRTPLNGIVGMTDLVLETPLTQTQQTYIDTVRRSSDALLSVINDILDFSKIEAGKVELDYHSMNLRDCVEESLDLVTARAAAKEIDLTYWISPEVPIDIVGDVTRIRQILANLLSNATKFTHQGGVFVDVNLLHDDGQSLDIHFSVADTGIGIPRERVNQLFDSFSQADASTTRLYGGTGLGLTIAKLLCELMGGKIWVESQVNQGSTFHFTICVERSESPISAPLLTPEYRQTLHGRRLLLLADKVDGNDVLIRYAKLWGMVPIPLELACLNGRVSAVRNQSVDLIVIDSVLLDQSSVAQWIAQHLNGSAAPTTPPIVRVGVVGRTETSESAKWANATITKPLKPDNILQVFLSILRPGRLENEPPPAEVESDSMGAQYPLRILLAEDNPVNQKVAILLLERLGYSPALTVNGLEVLAALDQHQYDVILMDIQMPEMDGLEATRRIIQRYSPSERPQIIALTANAIKGDRERFLEAGMTDYLSKPVRLEMLRQTLMDCYDRIQLEKEGLWEKG